MARPAAGAGRDPLLQAAMKEIGNAYRQEVGRSANNSAESARQPSRRPGRAVLRSTMGNGNGCARVTGVERIAA